MYLNTDLIKYKQAIKGWTQEDLANHAGLSRGTVIDMYNKRTASVKTVKSIANCLDMTLEEMYLPFKQQGVSNA